MELKHARIHPAQPRLLLHHLILGITSPKPHYRVFHLVEIRYSLSMSPALENFHHTNLLSLPRELRDLVYLYLVLESRQPPNDPDHAGEREFHSKINFEARSPRPALLQLKLCNRQIYAEVHDTLIKHASHDPDPARLDVMVKGSVIYPTWIFLPSTTCLHPIYDIDLRLFETRNRGSEFSTGAYRALWSLFNLLVSRGPCLIHNRIGLSTPMRIGRLRFEIKLCFPTSADDLFGTYRDVFDRLEKLAFDNVGLGNVDTIEARMGPDRRVWRLKQLPTGLTLPSRIE